MSPLEGELPAMRLVLGFAVFVSLCAVLLLRPDEKPTAQAVVQMPPAELYASLAELYGDIERKSASVQTVTGRPPIPVKFSFARSEGEMLSMTGSAGFRSVRVKAWIEDGEHDGESLLKIQAEPESLLRKSGESDPYRALRKILRDTSAQFVEGKRVTALFGGSADN